MTKEKIQKIIVEKLNEYKFELPKDEYELVAEELAEMIVKNCTIPDVVDSEAELCGKRGCNRPKMDGNVYCSYHYEVNFG